MNALDAEVAGQLRQLDIQPDRPLIVCDVDEVVLHFIRGLEAHLETSGYWLDPQSFALNGNIRRLDSNEAADTDKVRELLFGFFDENIGTMELVDGAVESLDALSSHAQIVLLTNLPPRYLDARKDHLAAHGLAFPVVANVGPKGPTVATMTMNHGDKVVFLDDIPSNILSVAEHVSSAGLIHFMRDPRFARFAGRPDGILHQTDNWPDARRFIEDHLGGSGGRA
jgi:hypothetical protein